jgi:hypothetical protein
VAITSKIFKGLVFGLTLIILGLFTGHIARQLYDDYSQIRTDISDAGTTSSSTPLPPPNNNHYIVSPPSQGRVNFIIPVEFNSIYEGKTSIILPAESNGAIQRGQNILLYDIDANLLDALGQVSDVEQKNQKSLLINIVLNNLPNGKAPHPSHGEIIIEEVPLSYRLPLSALKQASDEQYYLWEIARIEEGKGKTILRVIDNVKFPNNEFFTFDRPKEYVSNIYITNPDQHILPDQIISVTESLFRPTAQINAKIIADIPAQEPDFIPPGIQTTSGSCGEATASCGGSGASDFIQTIRNMAPVSP